MPYLVRRSKWRELQRNVRYGDLVLVVDEDVPRGRWRVTAPIASADGLVLSAEVATKKGTLVRPIGKLALLEASEQQ